LTNDKGYLDAIDTIWNDVADKKLYITGGIGATGDGEAFGEAYDLPNMSAYAETCAAIGNVYWNQRMFLLHGDSKYMDVLERTLYNGLLSGISLSGNRFFYPNVLASVGQHQRSGWFNCACCITNMTRFLPSMPGYIYAQNDNDLYVNLYVSSNANIKLKSTNVQLIQQTEYPWQGKVNITVDPTKTTAFTLHVRIPGWATDQPVTTSDLYSFMGGKLTSIPVYVNGKKINYTMQKGYAIINRTWKKDDKITIDFPMNVQKITANDKVKADNERLALQRGPIVYCLEGIDQKDSSVQSLVSDTGSVINTEFKPNKLNGITELTFAGYAVSRNDVKDIVKKQQTLTAIPYYSWNNRGSSEMEVWIPYSENKAKPKAAPSIASKSTVTSSAKSKLMLKAVNDQYEPLDSKDQSLSYLHWWPAKDTMEWVQYDFDKAYSISQSKVYWYDDKPFGGCDLPASWKLLYKKGDEWIPVDTTTGYEIAKDKYNTVEFKPVTTTALRLVIQLPKNDASGIHEWIVE
ncbi:MAG: beta-L-arabinofuranosidase domain-containing protein, partial [Ferruginibacter sp.]